MFQNRVFSWFLATTVILVSALTPSFGNIDSDGLGDVFFAIPSTDSSLGSVVHWYKSTGNVHDLVDTGRIISDNVISMWVGDLDNDAYPDMIVGRAPGKGDPNTGWYEYVDGNWNLVFTFPAIGTAMVAVNAKDITVGDWDGDGINDVWISNNATWQYRFEKTGDNHLAYIESLQSGSVTSLTLGNWNYLEGGDLFIGKTNNVSWYEWIDGALRWKQNLNSYFANKVLLCSFDDDEWPDMLMIDTRNGDRRIAWLENHYSALPTSWIEVNKEENAVTNTGFVDFAVGDFDGDGISEMIGLKYDGTIKYIVAKSGVNPSGLYGEISGNDLGVLNATKVAIHPASAPQSIGSLMTMGPVVQFKPADFDQSGEVNFLDLNTLACQWLE